MSMINEVLGMQTRDLMSLNQRSGDIVGQSFPSILSKMMPGGSVESGNGMLESGFGNELSSIMGGSSGAGAFGGEELGFLPSGPSRFSSMMSPIQIEAQSKLMQLQSKMGLSPLLNFQANAVRSGKELVDSDLSLIAETFFQKGYTLSFQIQSEQNVNAKLFSEHKLSMIHNVLLQLAVLHQDPSATNYLFTLWGLGSDRSIAAKNLEERFMALAQCDTEDLDPDAISDLEALIGITHETNEIRETQKTDKAVDTDVLAEGLDTFKAKLRDQAHSYFSHSDSYASTSAGRLLSAFQIGDGGYDDA